jgi:hypothetical protein
MARSGILLSGAMMALAISISPTFAHDFWINHGNYKSPNDGSHCCGHNDCFMLSTDEVRATAAGWLIESLGETIPYSEAQTSEDGEFWRCKRYDGSRRCFFAPQPSS